VSIVVTYVPSGSASKLHPWSEQTSEIPEKPVVGSKTTSWRPEMVSFGAGSMIRPGIRESTSIGEVPSPVAPLDQVADTEKV